jgi:hypothetical protein
MEDNMASRSVLQKAGLHEAGRIRCATSSAGRQVDRIYLDLMQAKSVDPFTFSCSGRMAGT